MGLLLSSLRYKRPAPPLSETFSTITHRYLPGGRGRKGENPSHSPQLALRRSAHTGEAVNKTLHNKKRKIETIESRFIICLPLQRPQIQPARFGDPTGDQIAGRIPAHQATGRRPPCHSDSLVERLQPGIFEARHYPDLRVRRFIIEAWPCPRLDFVSAFHPPLRKISHGGCGCKSTCPIITSVFFFSFSANSLHKRGVYYLHIHYCTTLT